MQNRIRYTRIALTGLGVWTVLSSFIVISWAWQEEAYPDISLVIILFGVLLALGGGCLALRGMKYGTPGTVASPGR